MRKLNTLRAAFAASLALAALGGGAASASAATANFSPSGLVDVAVTGTLNVSENGGTPLACSTSPAWAGFTYGDTLYGDDSQEMFYCPSGKTLGVTWAANATKDSGVYHLTLQAQSTSSTSPWGQYFVATPQAVWTNGSGSTASTMTFTNQTLGSSTSPSFTLKISGTLTVKQTPGGGLVTLI